MTEFELDTLSYAFRVFNLGGKGKQKGVSLISISRQSQPVHTT